MENKDLLLKYLCMALPYGVMIQYHTDYNWAPVQMYNISKFTFNDTYRIENCKPYLRTLSSMTEEEKEEMHNLLSPEGTAIYGYDGISMPMNHYGEFVPYEFMSRIIQYLLKNHFDFMELIPKDLAIEVTESNNPYKD